MTAHTTISNALVAVGAKPFATTVQAMRDNLYSVIEGDATAVAAGKQVARAALVDAIINRAKLDSTLVTQAYSLTTGTSVTVTMNPYSFFPGNTGPATVSIQTNSVSETPRLLVNNPSGSSQSGNIFWRYINA